ncbi:hypothetical protein G6F24_014555 [Rhizopus arrhizus]|nr:hypothetical protein G6F24_014555 [Rhizopus arrhizus]
MAACVVPGSCTEKQRGRQCRPLGYTRAWRISRPNDLRQWTAAAPAPTAGGRWPAGSPHRPGSRPTRAAAGPDASRPPSRARHPSRCHARYRSGRRRCCHRPAGPGPGPDPCAAPGVPCAGHPGARVRRGGSPR